MELKSLLECESVRSALWDFAAGALDEGGRLMVTAHLEECRECSLRRAEVRSLRTGLKAVLPEKSIPSMLATRLRVTASRERARQALRRSLATRTAELRSRMKLTFDNLLRPIAVPAAGGMLASFFCIAMIVDTLQYQPAWQGDIPVGLYTQVAMDDASPFPSHGNDIMVELTIDANGIVTGFEVPQGNVSPEEMQEIGNLVLYSSFSPATAFGQPVTGKILVNIVHLDVRG
jgi:hypothetical protein